MRSWPRTRAQAPAGGHRAAARLASRTGLAVEKPDIEGLAAAGLLPAAGWCKHWPLRDCRELDGPGAGRLAGHHDAGAAAC